MTTGISFRVKHKFSKSQGRGKQNIRPCDSASPRRTLRAAASHAGLGEGQRRHVVRREAGPQEARGSRTRRGADEHRGCHAARADREGRAAGRTDGRARLTVETRGGGRARGGERTGPGGQARAAHHRTDRRRRTRDSGGGGRGAGRKRAKVTPRRLLGLKAAKAAATRGGERRVGEPPLHLYPPAPGAAGRRAPRDLGAAVPAHSARVPEAGRSRESDPARLRGTTATPGGGRTALPLAAPFRAPGRVDLRYPGPGFHQTQGLLCIINILQSPHPL
ncbi:uncharacterized protein LOC143658260 [Tamandua tetradactyla]|uniref:uncharacterized protein LOC143658260 n=1 Tax=Tamandua tetradactyla TaxID=48850 RepID=UPI0040540E96